MRSLPYRSTNASTKPKTNGAPVEGLDLNRRVALAIRIRREDIVVTQAALAAAAGMSRSSIANIEAGRQTITLRQLESLARALGLPVMALVDF